MENINIHLFIIRQLYSFCISTALSALHPTPLPAQHPTPLPALPFTVPSDPYLHPRCVLRHTAEAVWRRTPGHLCRTPIIYYDNIGLLISLYLTITLSC